MKLLTRGLITSLTVGILSSAANAEVKLVTLQPSLRQTTITGFTRARSTISLSTEVAGKIDTVFADIGEEIPQQGKLTCLDDTFIKIDIASAENDIAQHNIDINFYQKQVARHEKLVTQNTTAISVLDDLKRQLGNSKKALRRAGLQKQRLREQRRRHCVEAPAGWRIVERHIEPKQWIDAGTLVAKASDYSRLLVPLALSVKELTELKQQANDLKVNLPEYNQQVTATIERISPMFDEQSHKILVDLLIKDNLPEYRGGIRVELLLGTAGHSGAFFIPKKALDERYEEYWLERQDGQRFSVNLLSYQGQDLAKISSPKLKATDKFKILQP